MKYNNVPVYHEPNHLESHQLVQQPTWTSICATIIQLTTIEGGSPESRPYCTINRMRVQYRVSIIKLDTVSSHTTRWRGDRIHRRRLQAVWLGSSTTWLKHWITFARVYRTCVSANRVFGTCRWINQCMANLNHDRHPREGGREAREEREGNKKGPRGWSFPLNWSSSPITW